MQNPSARQQGEAIEKSAKPARPYIWALVAAAVLIVLVVLIARPGDEAADGVTAGMSQVESARDPAGSARTPATTDR
ncbi:hypothetical protein [Caulobacter segnis]|uniref:hypothetical protein n=1 Tax=Caulobacter segnis TaxID=88688 RepID=UPI002410AB9A|nr:hypothetical protein [Caulobacter segnis]